MMIFNSLVEARRIDILSFFPTLTLCTSSHLVALAYVLARRILERMRWLDIFQFETHRWLEGGFWWFSTGRFTGFCVMASPSSFVRSGNLRVGVNRSAVNGVPEWEFVCIMFSLVFFMTLGYGETLYVLTCLHFLSRTPFWDEMHAKYKGRKIFMAD
jgi:hypothetical protein